MPYDTQGSAIGSTAAGAKPARTSPFRLTLFSDIALDHQKEWLIEDMLGAGETSCWYGYPGSAKSALAGAAAAHVAAGKPWFGRSVQKGAVLYIAAERAGLVKRRFAAWRKHHDLDDIPLGVLDGGAFDLFTSSEHADEVIRHGLELAEKCGSPVGWVIIDTKTRVMAGGDPNSDADIMGLLTNIRHIQHGLGEPHVTLIDHVPHSAPERMKGSGDLGAYIDASFLIKKEGEARIMTLGSKEPNDGPETLMIRFALQSVAVGAADDANPTTAPVVVEGDPPESVPKQRLTPGGQIVYAAYRRLLDVGMTVSGVRPGTRAVTLAALQDQALAEGLYPHPEPEEPEAREKWQTNRRQAWSRGLKATQDAGMLRLESGFLWDPAPSVTERDQERDRP